MLIHALGFFAASTTLAELRELSYVVSTGLAPAVTGLFSHVNIAVNRLAAALLHANPELPLLS